MHIHVVFARMFAILESDLSLLYPELRGEFKKACPKVELRVKFSGELSLTEPNTFAPQATPFKDTFYRVII